jgi:hypothetical protein
MRFLFYISNYEIFSIKFSSVVEPDVGTKFINDTEINGVNNSCAYHFESYFAI